jgi:hypothetical protein
MTQPIYEGTWEEIVSHASELTGRRVRLTVLDHISEEASQLMDMVGGHPALVQIALYHLSRGELTLAQVLATAPTSTGIYSHHLQRHMITLQEQHSNKEQIS